MPSSTSKTDFDRPRHPGEVLKDDILVPFDIRQKELVQQLGWSFVELDDFIFHGSRLTASMALDLASAFRTSPDFWMNLQAKHEIWIETRNRTKTIHPLLSFNPFEKSQRPSSDAV